MADIVACNVVDRVYNEETGEGELRIQGEMLTELYQRGIKQIENNSLYWRFHVVT